MKKWLQEYLLRLFAPALHRELLVARTKRRIARRHEGKRLPVLPVGEIEQEIEYSRSTPDFV